MLASEGQRRKVDLLYDYSPAKHHLYNFNLSKKYISGKSVLDIGCWTGQIETLAVKLVKNIIGIDPNTQAINQARKLVPQAQFKVANALSLPFKKNLFDTVLFFEVIEHLPDNSESRALFEINRVLKTNGYLIMSTPNNNWLSIVFDPAYFLIGHRHYSITQLREILHNNGFRIVKINITGSILFLLKSILELLWKHVFRKRINFPMWYKKRLDGEYIRNGIASIHVVCKKSIDVELSEKVKKPKPTLYGY